MSRDVKGSFFGDRLGHLLDAATLGRAACPEGVVLGPKEAHGEAATAAAIGVHLGCA